MRIGVTEILLILLLVLVIFGGGKLAGVGKAVNSRRKSSPRMPERKGPSPQRLRMRKKRERRTKGRSAG